MVIFHKRWANQHAARLDLRLRARRGHGKAVIAVAGQLAEAAYWVIKKREPYRGRDGNKPVSSNQK